MLLWIQSLRSDFEHFDFSHFEVLHARQVDGRVRLIVRISAHRLVLESLMAAIEDCQHVGRDEMLLAVDDLWGALFGLELAEQPIIEIEPKGLARAGHCAACARPVDVRI